MRRDPWQRAEVLRAQIREFCQTSMPPDILGKSSRHLMLNKEEYVRWMRALQSRGWAVGHWPREYGGLDWSALERLVFEDELARAGCPWVIPFGVKYVGPVIYSFGTDEQKRRFLPPITATEAWWAQGYSEPGAGSDLASLRTTAERRGDYYLVNGQKCWTTYAQWADWIFCLVRTARDEHMQKGISFLLIEMHSPGVTVRPVRTLDQCHHVNEVWLDNVSVPVENRVGEEGDGWKLAKFLLNNERTYGAGVGEAWFALARLKNLAADCSFGGPSLIKDSGFRRRLGELELRVLTLETLSYQSLADQIEGSVMPAEASMLKLRASEVYQDLIECTADALGYAGIAYDPQTLHGEAQPPLGPEDAAGILRYHLYNRAATIYGGSTEIQRNIIAKSALGLQ
jgi:hypothetical protein